MTRDMARLPSEIALPHVAMSDADLVAGIAAGDKVAMRVLYSRHSVAVFRFAMRLLDSRMAAEDVVIEVFLAVWRDANRFRERSRVATWLLAIARHKAVDALRQRQCEQLDDDVAALIEDLSDNSEAVVNKEKTCSIIRNCLNHLSPKHREIIDLIYYEDKSIDEVAKIVGIMRNTVKTRMFYARKRLTALLVTQGIDASYT
jgi:RNA polymerase sigma-70 factor (ECF subfamily)